MKTTFEEILDRDGKLVYRTKGISMEPMLRQNRDIIIVEKNSSRLKRFDVALYKRGKSYVLHRVIKVMDGYYIIRGDNTYSLEEIPESDVIGVLRTFVRKGRTVDVDSRTYRMYARFWNSIYPIRSFFMRCRRKASRILKGHPGR